MAEKVRPEDQKGPHTKFGRNRSNGRAAVVPAHATFAFRSTAPLICNHGAKWRRVVSITFRPLYPGKENPVPIEYEAGGARAGLLEMRKNFSGFDLATVQPNHKIMPDNAHEDSDHIQTLQHNTKV